MAGGALKMPDSDDLEVTQSPARADLDAIQAGLIDYSRAYHAGERQTLCVFARNAPGALTGGLYAQIVGDVLLIKELWVDTAARKTGLGRRLMEKAESEGLARGCSRAAVDTMSFQAPGFYTKLGYREKATVPDFYAGHDRIFYEKTLC